MTGEHFYHTLEWNEMFKSALQAILVDDGFKFPSDPARRALHIAAQLLSWCGDTANEDALTSFVSLVFELFDRCISCTKQMVSHTKIMEKIWGMFHQEHCLSSYRSSWSAFLATSLHCTDVADPIFYQFITDHMLKQMLKKMFTMKERDCDVCPEVSLSYEEKNTVRFIAGSLVRALHRKIAHSTEPLKKEMLLCLSDLLDNADCPYDESCDWVAIRDRGGLNHVSNTMFMLISTMEVEVKNYISRHQATDFNMKKVLSEQLLAHDMVEFYWEEISLNWGEKESNTLLAHIIDYWLTMRGFAYTSQWMENYKSITKKKVQKSKGIRKTIMGATCSSTADISSEVHE